MIPTPSVLKESPGQPGGRIDPLVALTGIAGIGLVGYALSSIPSSGEIPTMTLVSFAIGLAMIGLFVPGERRSASPIVPQVLFRRRELLRPIIDSFFHGASTNTWIFFYSIYLQQLRYVSPWATGLTVDPCTIAVVAGTSSGGRIGFGLGLAQVGFFEMATEHSASEDRGAVGAGINAAAQIGTAIGLAILVVSSAWFANEIDQIRFSFAGGGLIAVAGGLTVLFLPGDLKRDNPKVSTRQTEGRDIQAEA